MIRRTPALFDARAKAVAKSEPVAKRPAIAAVVLAALALVAAWIGGFWFMALWFAAAALALWEGQRRIGGERLLARIAVESVVIAIVVTSHEDPRSRGDY